MTDATPYAGRPVRLDPPAVVEFDGRLIDARAVPGVAGAGDALDDALDMLDGSLARFLDDLAPILRPEDDGPEGPSPSDGIDARPASAHVTRLRWLTQRVDNARRRVEAAHLRLDGPLAGGDPGRAS